jgi:predicted acylesterase/phospholipase RssA
MLTLKTAPDPVKSNLKTGLALAGGGPLGGFYELGALCALEDSLSNLNLTDLDVFVGVSAGAFLAASLANGLSITEIANIFAFNRKAETPFNPDHFLQPAYGEYLKRVLKIPLYTGQALLEWARNPLSTSAVDMLEKAGRALPTGTFNNAKLERFLKDVFTRHGQGNDFRQLDKKLYIVACELDSGRAAVFSQEKHSEVPISKAIQASSALPGLYPPVKINDKYYVDGALRRTMNASAALKNDVQLLFAVNPLVPFDSQQRAKSNHLMQGGLPMVLSQTFRSIVQSRLKSGLEKYSAHYPHADILLIEPDSNDEVLFTTNLFSYGKRDKLCEYAYQRTRNHLRDKAAELEPVLARHGISLDEAHLFDEKRQLTDMLKTPNGGIHEKLDQTLNQLDRSLKILSSQTVSNKTKTTA